MAEESLPDLPNRDQYFRTEHLQSDIGGRTVRGGAVAITTQSLKFFITIAGTSVMAHLLTPEDYGLVGMVAIVTGFVSTYKDLGLGTATVQSPEISFDQISTLFWINLALSVAIAIFTATIAPLVAWFYGEPRLKAITAVTALGFVMSGLVVQHEALLRRQMRFFELAMIGLISMAIGYLAGILMAWWGFKYWSLVGSQFAVIITATTLTWMVCRWRPGLPRKNTGVRSMINFGGNLTAFATINYFARNLDNLLIGRVWGAQQLGIYSRAYQLMMLPIEQINEPITSVAVPSLSRLTNTEEGYRRAYLRMLETVALLTMPAVALMIASADWIVAIVLGPKWGKVGTVLVILGVAGLVQPISNTTGWLFITQGRANDLFKLSMIGGPITMLSIVAGLPWGARGVATSYVAVQLCVSQPLLYWFIGRKGPVRMMDFYRTIAPMVVGSVMSLVAAMAVRQWLGPVNPVVGILVCLVVILLTTLLVLSVVPSGQNALKNAFRLLIMLRRKPQESLDSDSK